MIHHSVKAEYITEQPVEEAVGNEALIEADKMLAEGNAQVALVSFYGLDGLFGHFHRREDAEDRADAVEHTGIDEIRGDGGYLYGALLALQLYANTLAPAECAPLGGGVKAHLRKGQHTGGGGDVADMPATALSHTIDEAQRHIHCTFSVDVDGAVDVFICLLREDLIVCDNAGVVDEDVHIPAGGLRGLAGLVDGLGGGDIGLESIYRSQAGKLFHRRFDGGFIDVPDYNLGRTLLQAYPGHKFADSGARPGDQNAFFLYFHFCLDALLDSFFF